MIAAPTRNEARSSPSNGAKTNVKMTIRTVIGNIAAITSLKFFSMYPPPLLFKFTLK